MDAGENYLWQHTALLKTLGRPQDTLQIEWLVYSDAQISVCSKVHDEEQLPSVAPTVVPTADKKRTAGRQLGNKQVTAIHRFGVQGGELGGGR